LGIYKTKELRKNKKKKQERTKALITSTLQRRRTVLYLVTAHVHGN